MLPIPINPGSPIDLAHAVGRRQEVADVMASLSSGVGVCLTGERRHGKTTLARLVEQDADSRGWTVVTRSAEGFTSRAEFTERLAGDLVQALPAMERARAWLRARAQFSAGPVAIAPEELHLDELVREACAHSERLLIVVDELPIFAKALEVRDPGSGLAMLHTLRRLRQENAGKLTMLCLGSIGFHHVVAHLGGAINDIDKRPLRPLTPDSATELAARLLAGTAVPVASHPDLASAIALASEGIPHYAHHLARDCRTLHGAGNVVSKTDVFAAVASALTDVEDRWDLKHYVTRIPDYYGQAADHASVVLDAIAESPQNMASIRTKLATDHRTAGQPVDVPDIVGRLEADYYLLLQADGLRRFRSALVRRAWVRWTA